MMFMNSNIDLLFARLSHSKFRSSFHLSDKDKAYVLSKGLDTIEQHAKYFVAKRLAPKDIKNDGKQTPFKGHPVFVAQHACACCCRGCLYKWHHIKQNKELSHEEQEYIVSVLMHYIKKEISI